MIAAFIGPVDSAGAFVVLCICAMIFGIIAVVFFHVPRKQQERKQQLEYDKAMTETRLNWEFKTKQLEQNLITSHKSADQ